MTERDTLRKDTNSGSNPKLDTSCSVPDDAQRPDGQYVDHWVLPDEERAKGFVRPVRLSYRHVGLPAPQALRDLTAEEHEQYDRYGYVKFEEYPASRDPVTGRYWTQEEIDKINKGCGVVTRMPIAIAETYAREPNYYGSTFCCGCGTYLRVGKAGEFVWEGTQERVGT